ncbi:MAG TPA: SdrD B-like domain-containing protein [Iamia sp.]
MTAPTVRTMPTSQQRRAPRLAMVVALVVATLGALGASTLTSAPVAAITPSVDFFRGETQMITADPAPGGSLNQLRATFVVQHDAGLTVNGMRTNRGINSGGFGAWGGVGGTVRKIEGTNGIAYSVVEAAFSPGTGNWPDFTCPLVGTRTRHRSGTASIQLRLSNGVELTTGSWGYATASESQCTGTDDYPVAHNNHNTTVNGSIASNGSFHVAYECDDNDASGGGDNCDYANLRVRRLNDDQTFALTCVSGMACNNTAPTANFNADDNTRRDFDISHSSSWGTRGRFVIEANFCQDGSCRSAGWSWLGSYEVNDAAPTVSIGGTATQAGSSTVSSFAHPATNATITATATVSGDAQVIDWDLDNNGSFETTEVGTSGTGEARTLSVAQRTQTVDLNGRGAGTDCSVRARVRDNGAVSTASYSAKTSGVQTIACTTNRLPTGASDDVLAHQGTPLPITLAADDADSDPTTCEIVTAPTKGGLSTGTSCARTYTANLLPDSADFFTYRVKDDHNGTSTTTYRVDISIVNQGPTADAQELVVFAGEPTTINMTGSDPDLDPLTCDVTTQPTKGVLSGTGCSPIYTSSSNGPNQGVGGVDFLEYTVSDGIVDSDPAPVDLVLRNPNLSLTKSHSGRFNVGTGTGTYTLTVSNSNTAPAYGTTTVTDTLPAGMTYRSSDPGTSGFTCTGTPGVSTTVSCSRSTPAIPRNSSVSFTITVDVATSSGSTATNTASVTNPYELATTVANNSASDATGINRRPTITDSTAATDVNVPVSITFAGSDPEGDPLTYVTNTPGHGTVTGTGATRTYTPDTGFQGIDTFAVQATDTGTPGLSATATVTVYVGVRPLSGTVTDELDGSPIAGVEARLVDLTDRDAEVLAGTVITDAQGHYDFVSLFPQGVPNAPYGIRFVDPGRDYLPEWYDDGASSATATIIDLSAAPGPVVRDVELTPGGRIQGTVRSEAAPHAPIEGMQVRLMRIGGSGSSAITTNSGGLFRFDLLRPGTYQLWFRDLGTDFISEWYSNSPTQTGSATVTVTTGQQVVIDEQIEPVAPPPPPDSGSITGTIRSRGPGNAPIAGIQVRIYLEPYTKSSAATTDANGQYSFTRLPPGNWKVWFRDVTGNQFISQYNGDASTLNDSTAIPVANDGHVVDAQLAPKVTPGVVLPAAVAGTVTELDGVTPIAGLNVRLYPVGGTTSKATTTGANGTYAFNGLAAGQYQVVFRDTGRTWINEWNLDQPTQATADPVTATSGVTTTVDAQIARR